MKTFMRLIRSLILLVLAAGAVFAEVKTSGDWKYNINEKGDGVITGYLGSGADLEMPTELDGITIKEIGREAFLENKTLTSIVIPDSVRTIGNQAFHLCENLAVVKLGDSVENIDDSAFRKCTSLEEINLPASLTRIGSTAFDMLVTPSKLRKIVIPDSVDSIGEAAFRDCNPEVAAAIPDRFAAAKSAILGDILPTGAQGRGAMDHKASSGSEGGSKSDATSITVGDLTYENVRLKKEYPASFFIHHSGGTAFIEKAKLSEDQVASVLASETSQPATASNPAPGSGMAEPKTEEVATAEDVVGQEATEIRLVDHDLKESKLSDLRGKVVLLNFNNWGGCPESCLPDFPLLAELHEKYAGEPVEVVSVLSTFNERTWEEALEKQNITWKTNVPSKLFEDEETPEELRSLEPLPEEDIVEKLSKSYGIKTFASTFVVGKDGLIVGAFGPVSSQKQEVEAAIAKALAN